MNTHTRPRMDEHTYTRMGIVSSLPPVWCWPAVSERFGDPIRVLSRLARRRRLSWRSRICRRRARTQGWARILNQLQAVSLCLTLGIRRSLVFREQRIRGLADFDRVCAQRRTSEAVARGKLGLS